MTGFSTTVMISRPPWIVGSNVLEQPGGVERLHAFVDLKCVEAAARPGPEIGADGVGFDPLIAFDHDRADSRRLRIGHARRERQQRRAPTKSRRGPSRRCPAPEQSRLQIFIPYTPFIVPFEHPTRRSRERSRSPAACTVSARIAATQFPLPRLTRCHLLRLRRRPSGGRRCSMSLYVAKIISIRTSAKSDPETHFLRALRKRPSSYRLDCVEHKMPAIEQRNREQVEQPDRNRQHRSKAEHAASPSVATCPETCAMRIGPPS